MDRVEYIDSCHSIIGLCDVPTVYSNRQSYYECLCYLQYKINECIEAINGYADEYKSYTDSQISILRAQLEQKIAELRTYVEEKNTELYSTIFEEVGNLDRKYSDITNKINLSIIELDRLVKELNAEMYNFVIDEIKKVYEYIKTAYCENVKCYNVVTGSVDSICDVLQSMYGALRYYGITANDFDKLGLTCDEFANRNLSASEFDLYSDLRLGKPSLFYMHSMKTGELVFYQDVINMLWDYHRQNPITASEFDAKELTATVFDGKQITAFNFDNNAKTLL